MQYCCEPCRSWDARVSNSLPFRCHLSSTEYEASNYVLLLNDLIKRCAINQQTCGKARRVKSVWLARSHMPAHTCACFNNSYIREYCLYLLFIVIVTSMMSNVVTICIATARLLIVEVPRVFIFAITNIDKCT